MHGSDGALWLIIWRVVQGIGGALALTGRRTPAPAGYESLGYELAAVAGEGGFEPGELVIPSVPEESTGPPDQPD